MPNRPVVLLAAFAWLAAGCEFKPSQSDGSGTIECTQVQVSPSVAGRIHELPVSEGQALQQGDLVARLDDTDYALKRDEARAALALAQAQLDLMVAGSRAEDIQRAREAVREAQAAAWAAAQDLKRLQGVFALGSATQKQVDDAKAQGDRTAAALSGAEQNLAKLLRGNRQEEIRIAQAQVDQTRARLAQTEKAVADCLVTAPMAGVVTTKNRELGEFVGSGAALITLSRLDEVWLSLYLPETRLASITLGQPAHVRIDGDRQSYTGTVTFISPEAEFTPRNVQTPDERAKLVYRVKVTLQNPRGVFKPGMPADGYLSAGSEPQPGGRGSAIRPAAGTDERRCSRCGT